MAASRALDVGEGDLVELGPLTLRPEPAAPLRARGKLPKVALVACMRKLLVAVYAVAKHRRPFVPEVAGGPA